MSNQFLVSERQPILITVVIPVYNNEASLRLLCKELSSLSCEQGQGLSFEVLLIDDGSQDESWNVISEICNENPQVFRGIKLSRNFGQLAAMIAGWESSTGDAVINISADLQDPVSIIPELINSWRKGADLVVGRRDYRSDPIGRRVASWIAHSVIKKMQPQMPETWFDITLMSRRVTDVVISMKGRRRFSQGDQLYVGFVTEEVPYSRRRRSHGRSGYGYRQLLNSFLNSALDSYEYLPRHLFQFGAAVSLIAIIGVLTTFVVGLVIKLSLVGLIYLLWSLIFLLGANLAALGLLAYYVWSTYDISRNRPTYIIETRAV